MPFPEGYENLAREIARVLKPGGLFAMRAFVKPAPSESFDQLVGHLNAGAIGSFHVFKWRLNMALQADIEKGIRLRDVWTAFMREFENPAAFAARRGWTIEDVETIHAYRNADARYTFPTLPELRKKLSAHFSEHSCIHPQYEMGERCPTLLFEAN